MRKAAAIFIALTFTASSIGMWYLTWVAINAFELHLAGKPLPALTWQVLSVRNALLWLPLPFVIWCIAILRRPAPSADHVLLFTAISLFVLSVTFFTLALALLLPPITIVDF